MRVEEERRAKERLLTILTVKLRTHTETEQARNGRQKIELTLDVDKAGQGKRELWNKQLWSCSLLLARGEEKEFLDQLTGALGDKIQCTCIGCERQVFFMSTFGRQL